jgi:hypothetical protein
MLIETRHNFNEIAGFMSYIQLLDEYFIPSIFAGAWAARQCKHIGAIGHAARGAALNR